MHQVFRQADFVQHLRHEDIPRGTRHHLHLLKIMFYSLLVLCVIIISWKSTTAKPKGKKGITHMTLAEKITHLKQAEKQAWERYSNAVDKEVNALLKRCGDDNGVTGYVMTRAYEEAKKNNVVVNKLDPMVLAYTLVRKFAYIVTLRDKWVALSSELTQIGLALSAEDKDLK